MRETKFSGTVYYVFVVKSELLIKRMITIFIQNVNKVINKCLDKEDDNGLFKKFHISKCRHRIQLFY